MAYIFDCFVIFCAIMAIFYDLESKNIATCRFSGIGLLPQAIVRMKLKTQ